MATAAQTEIDRINGDLAAQSELISQIQTVLAVKAGTQYETWTFEMEDGSTVTKEVAVS